MKKQLLLTMALAAAMAANAGEIVLPTTATEKLTLKGEVGTEVTITLGVYASEDVYAVDFGDGVQKIDSVGNENGGIKDENGLTREGTAYKSSTKFTGTVAGDGIIKVYGTSDLWYLLTSGGAYPTTFDQPQLLNVVQMSISGADVESIALPASDKLKQFTLNNSAVKTLDVTKAIALTSLSVNSTTASKFAPQLESIDLSKNTELASLSLQGNQNNYGKLTTLDLTNNTKLDGMGLFVMYNQLTELKLGENTLTSINVQNNQLTTLEWSKLSGLKSLYAADNLLESIDVSGMANLAWLDVKNNKLKGDLDLTANLKFTNVYVNNNRLTSVKVTDVTKQFYVDGNLMTLATLPAQPAGLNSSNKTKQFHYAPQAAMEIPAIVFVGDEIDLTSQLNVEKGELNPDGYAENLSGTTTYSFVTETGTALVEGIDYEQTAPGKFKLLTAQAEKTHAVMLNSAFPKFTAALPFVTSNVTVTATPILTLKGTVGNEVQLTFGVYDTEDAFAVDFGDGEIQIDKVGVDNKGPVKEDGTTGSATKFTGTVAGDGVIKVYGANDIWYLLASGGAIPTTFDQEKLMNVVQMSITGADVKTVELPAYTKMTQFSLNNTPVEKVDVSKVPTLTSLTINNTTASKFAPQLTSIDVSKNEALTYLSLQGNQNNYGKLKVIDLTGTPFLENLFVQYNAIEEVTFGAGSYQSLGMVNVQNNKLTEFDAKKLLYLRDLYISDNQLTSIDLSNLLRTGGTINVQNNQLTELALPVSVKILNAENNKLQSVSVVDATSQCKLANNCLTLATLPVKPEGLNTPTKLKNFTYAPQAAIEVPADVVELNLESQLMAQGILEAPVATTFAFVTAGGTTLEQGADYTADEKGHFTFVKSQTEKVHGVLTTEAFPLFTGSKALVTTEFTVAVADAIKSINATAVACKVYNLQGQEVKQPAKGLFIQDGKKVIVK